MDKDDYEVVLLLAAGCSLDSSPKSNWVQRAGGLPNYICEVAKGIMRSGRSKSQAIAIAVSRIKKWAAGGDDVEADTRAKAARALAQWNKLKAKNKAKGVIAASYVDSEGTEQAYLMLTNIPSFKTDIVRMAWTAKQNARYDDWRSRASDADVPYVDRWIEELWTDHIIVAVSGVEQSYEKVPYTVNPLTDEVTFGEAVPVKKQFVETVSLTDAEKALLSDLK